MKKKIDIEALERKNPFSVPNGYFEGLANRVMSSIPEAEGDARDSSSAASSTDNPKVVGLLPRKKKNGWVKWVAAAACLCGVAFFVASQQGGESGNATGQLANMKPATAAPTPTVNDETEAEAVEQETAPAKVYANNAYDLSHHVRRSATPAPANITPQPVVRTSTTIRTPSVQIASTKTTTSAPAATTPAKTVVYAPSAQTAMLASNTTPKAIVSQTSQSDTDTYAAEYDMLDYTNMSGTEIYDYLAGNEYY